MPPENLTLSVVRPDDLLILTLDFENVLVTPPQAGQPGEIGGTGNALLTVHLQPQHVAEQAFLQVSQDHQVPVPSDEPPLPPGSVQSRLAGPSRLVFTVPAGETIPLTLEGLLDAFQRLPLRVSAVNRWQPPGCLSLFLWFTPPPSVAPPAAADTAIEAPYRLILSPDELARWRHALAPVVRGDWIELWHTRLGTSRSDGDPRVRAIWSPDFKADSVKSPFNEPPFRSSLTSNWRNEIVHLTSNYRIPNYLPAPVKTERFTLSSLGAWLKVEGSWDPPLLENGEALGVVNWRHEAMMGRDQYVRVVEAGYLLPCGHKAVLVTITERKFLYREDAQPPGNVAYLYQIQFIIRREITRSYSGRDMPFRSITLKTESTPNLNLASGGFGLGEDAFWPRIDLGGGPVDFQFHLEGTDWEGRPREWTAPLIFVKRNVDQNNIGPVLTEYNVNHGVDHPRRKRPLSGQSVAFAPAAKPGDTSFEAADITLEAIEVTGGDGPHFRPAMKQANVDVPAVKQLLGTSAPSKIEWEPSYLSGSGNKIGNKGDVFAKLVGSTPLEFATEKVGGMVAPDIGISGLSRALGPVGGPVSQMVGGSFKPQDIFPDVKLLGGINLFEIIKDLIFDAASTTAGKLPGLTTERDGNILRAKYAWKIGSSEMVQDHPLFRPTGSSEFTLEAVAETPIDGSPPTFRVAGSLTHFSVVLLPGPGLELVELTFESVSFTSVPDKKPDVAVQLGGIEFKGILEFVRRLQEYIPLDGFNDPPSLEIVQSPHPGINVGFSLGIPDIAIGIATLQNISLGAGFFLPFGDAPLNFHFAFCERQQPFILTVSLFGGGGFFGIDIGIDGVKMIEAALEFGASVALNLGVASGEASIMAGFYFQMVGKDFQLTGYFRAYGELSVLGIITVSLEFYLGLTYASKGISPHGGTLWGQASLKVKIEILFFSMSVSVSMEREFAGSDPKFRQMLTPADWEAYADAFAAYP
ncbi:MAG TPA: hypothetical protein VGX68_06275 [Thermoanaerobaculia bacterium]|jgi:hypothetical protein|nr:hypothetical protein [Thermoanaerobaculia bacterium]